MCVDESNAVLMLQYTFFRLVLRLFSSFSLFQLDFHCVCYAGFFFVFSFFSPVFRRFTSFRFHNRPPYIWLTFLFYFQLAAFGAW